MTRYSFIWYFVFALSILVLEACTNQLHSQSQKGLANSELSSKPNIILIYTDDHRYTGVQAFGGKGLKTPKIDALAADGISFSNAYTMGSFSGATCIPSRAMLMTGRNLFQLDGQGHIIPEAHKTMGEHFQQQGYRSHIVGKWHNDNPSLVRSFDDGDRIMGRGVYLTDNYRMPLWDWDPSGKFSKEDAYLLRYGTNGEIVEKSIPKGSKRGPTGTEKDGPHSSEIFAKEAGTYIANYNDEQPFFLYVAFPTPHDPRQAPERYHNMYPPEDIVLPPSYMAQHPFDNGHMVLRDEELAPWPRTEAIAKKELSDYYAIITHLDAQIGKLIDDLKKSGHYENTLIVFAGDSGLAVGNHGLLGKQNIYDEDGVHIPLIFSGPLIKDKGSVSDALTYNFDIFPTICDMAQIPIPESVTGKSILPVIEGTVDQLRTDTYHAYKQFQRSYRKGGYKLIEYVRADDMHRQEGHSVRGSRVTQLFNIKEDPWEVYDLSFFPDQSERVKTMRIEMRQKALQLGDNIRNIEGEIYDFWDYYELESE